LVVPLKTRNNLTICPSWKHHPIWSSVKRGEKFFDQPGFDPPCFARSNQVTNNRLQPCIFANPKNHTRMFVNIQFVHWRAGEQIAKSFYAFDHFPAQFFLGDFGIVLAMNFRSAL